MPEELLSEAEAEEVEKDQYLVFSIESQEYGIQAMKVQEISRVVPTTKIPNAPQYIEGIMNLRGKLGSVINFRRKFGFTDREPDEDTRIIIVERANFPTGIIIDKSTNLLREVEKRNFNILAFQDFPPFPGSGKHYQESQNKNHQALPSGKNQEGFFHLFPSYRLQNPEKQSQADREGNQKKQQFLHICYFNTFETAILIPEKSLCRLFQFWGTNLFSRKLTIWELISGEDQR